MRKPMIRITLLTLSLCCLIFSSVLTLETSFAQEPVTCPGFIQSRLVVGQTGRVTPGDANNVRAEPSRQATSTGSIPGEGVFTVLDGPICADDFAWWQVDYNGLIGWTVEGTDGQYWLEPYEACQSAFNIGDTIEVVFNYAAELYREPQRSPNKLAQLEEGTLVTMIDGPICDNIRWTWIKVNADGVEGWIEEKGYPQCDAYCTGDTPEPAVYYLRPPLNPLTPLDSAEIINRIEAGRAAVSLPANAISANNANELQIQNQIGDGQITDFEWSPTNAQLAVIGSADVRIYDPRSLNTLPYIITQHGGIPGDAVYSPDGQTLVTSDSSGAVFIWNSRNFELLASIERENPIGDLAFSEDGSLLVVGTGSNVSSWAMSSPDVPVLRHEFAIGGAELAFIGDSNRLVAVDNSVGYVLDADTGSALPLQGTVERSQTWFVSWGINSLHNGLTALTKTPWGGDYTVTYNYYVEGWNLDTGEALTSGTQQLAQDTNLPEDLMVLFNSNTDQRLLNLGDEQRITQNNPDRVTNLNVPDVTVADFSPDGSLLAFGTEAGGVQLFINHQYLDVLHGINGRVNKVQFSPDGQYLAALGADNSVRIWETEGRKRLGTVQFTQLARPRAISPDGDLFINATQLWEIESAQLLETFENPDDATLRSVQFREDDSPVALYHLHPFDDSESLGVVQEMRTGKALVTYTPRASESSTSFVFSGDYAHVADVDDTTEPNAATIYVFDAASGHEIQRLERYFQTVQHMVFSYDNRLLGIAGSKTSYADGSATIWDILTGDLLVKFTMDGRDMVFSPTNAAVAWKAIHDESADDEQTIYTTAIRYLDLIAQQTVSFVLPHNAIVTQFTFSPDGSLIVAGDDKGHLYIWDVVTGEEVAKIEAHAGSVNWLAFSADGTRLYSFGGEGVFKVWSVE